MDFCSNSLGLRFKVFRLDKTPYIYIVVKLTLALRVKAGTLIVEIFWFGCIAAMFILSLIISLSKILVNTYLQGPVEITIVKYLLKSYESARLRFKLLLNHRETKVSKEKQPNY